MKNLSITIHFPSCKSNGFLSNDFEDAIKAEFRFDQYNLKFSFSASPSDAYFDSGVSILSVETGDSTEVALVRGRIKDVFNRLVESASLPTSKT
ncbi:MAG: hypothetical protein U1D41_09865 [Nitrosomonas sp.]|uniref:hypothetical protein n=1 Tax=Nitrosomonas sp. TaxID=42353 RepID=UPI002736C096|nr:hypothetical protein [Nitrosomonas sp.]MDP3282082.1 hypothetical protein [Nitrosomonas sp.]MDP3662015.1 hypothetical protein [Nitrosomonas sp.]MDZ4106444.1 hypothetical protein [Nitrosomonas sp.]